MCWEAGRLEAAKGVSSRTVKHKIATMQQAVSQSFTSPEVDPLAEADDIDGLGNFLKSWEVPDQEVLRVKTLLASRTFTDVVRDDSPDVPVVQFDLAPEELAPDENLDEELSMKKKASEEKQQVWNRGRSELLGADHEQARTLLRAELAPGYFFPARARKQSKSCICWLNATCCRAWTTCLTSMRAPAFQVQTHLIRSASGARRQRTSRGIKIPHAPTPHIRVRRRRDCRVPVELAETKHRVKFSRK